MPDQDAIIRNILGIDEIAKNVCLIESHQMVNAVDLPGRLVAISADRKIPSDLLRYSFRKPEAKITTQVNPPTTPIQVTRLESSQAKSGSLLKWFGASMSKEDIVELRTVPLPATSISVDDLDEQNITNRFSAVPADIRKGLGIITDVIPYEVWASVCKKTTGKAGPAGQPSRESCFRSRRGSAPRRVRRPVTWSGATWPRFRTQRSTRR
jgi:hypothetical protein